MMDLERTKGFMIDVSPRRTNGTGSRGGPHPGVLAAVSLGLTVTALVTTTILTGLPLVSPFSPPGQVLAYFQDNASAVRLAGMIQFGSAIPVGIYAATIYARLLRLGVRVPGPAIGFFGGMTAATFLMLSGSVVWLLGRPEITAEATLTQALAFLAFITGGVGYVTGLGLLVAGTAVPGLILRLMPRWLAWAGLVIAALSELSFLSLTIEPLQFLLPMGRFAGLTWLVAAGFLLPRTRAAANRGAL
jgi:hypothetical protein